MPPAPIPSPPTTSSKCPAGGADTEQQGRSGSSRFPATRSTDTSGSIAAPPSLTGTTTSSTSQTTSRHRRPVGSLDPHRCSQATRVRWAAGLGVEVVGGVPSRSSRCSPPATGPWPRSCADSCASRPPTTCAPCPGSWPPCCVPEAGWHRQPTFGPNRAQISAVPEAEGGGGAASGCPVPRPDAADQSAGIACCP